jgi:hypothetical protein
VCESFVCASGVSVSVEPMPRCQDCQRWKKKVVGCGHETMVKRWLYIDTSA